MSVNKYDATQDLLLQIAGNGSEGSFHRTTPVQALTGATTVTIQDSKIHATSLVFPFADNGTNESMSAPSSITLTEGQCVLTFDALEADTDFTLVVLADSITEDAYLNDLTDVNISSVSNGQVLAYNGTTGKWVNINASSGLMPHLVITSEPNVSVVVTKGQISITASETSSGVYECDVPEFGTYTLTATKTGEEVVDYYNVTSVAIHNISLLFIPNGSTATPTDVVQTWLKCAAINDKSYTTLAEVLNDTDTFTALLQDSNACDYMARSTTWAVATGLVPTMTSNTTPSGTCSGTSEGSGNEYYKAFDGNENTFWQSQGTSAGVYPYLQYTFPETHDFRLIKFMCYKDSNTSALYYKITASSDGTNYSDIVSEQYVAAANLTDKQVFVHQINGNYISFRIYVWGSTFQSLTYASVRELQFYTDADITTNADAMARVGKYDYCSCALLGNSTWASAIVASSYADSIISALVPTMTSNTAPSGTAFASEEKSSSNKAFHAFDNSNSTMWACDTGVGNYLGYQYSTPFMVSKVVYNQSDNHVIKKAKLQGSNDGTTYTDIQEITLTQDDNEHEVIITNNASYLYHRLYITEVTSNIATVTKLQFYGHTAQTNIIHSAASDTLYYIDGSNQTIGTTDTSGVGTVDWSNVPVGNLTIYSSVANEPDDLTSAYSKTVRITPNTTEVWVMPDNALYWYGYNGGIEECSSANGWTWGGTFTSPSFNTNNITLSSSANTAYSAIATSSQLSIGKVINAVYTGTTAYSGIYVSPSEYVSKDLSSAASYDTWTNSGMNKKSYTMQGNDYMILNCANMTSTIHAFWYE